MTAITGVSAAAGLLFTYWAYETPQVIVQPIFMISAVVMPVLIGLFLYSERKKIHHTQWLYLAIGIVGAFVVAISKS
jgi:glucose uptake protein GlcU